MRRATFSVAAATILTALVFTVQASAAAASAFVTRVSCGQILSKSTTLANDLVDCPRSGLVIGADKITVDLNGHTIDGTNARKPGTGGIANDGHANVTIENGTITDFYFSGVSLSRRNAARKLTVRGIGAGCRQGDICAGIFLFKSAGSTITDSVVSNNVRAFEVAGIDVYNSPRTRIERNRLDENAGPGLSIFASPGCRVIGNELNGDRYGMDANNGSDAITVMNNHAHANHVAGIAVGALSGARILRNTASENGDDGFFLFDLRNSLVLGNRAIGNFTGLHLYGGQGGVAQYGGKHGAMNNRLIRNSATKNSHVGIWVKGDDPKDAVDGNLISGNLASGNGRAGGIAVAGSATRNTLRGNTANANAGHGIAANRGTIDGSGNKAHRNRRLPQCIRVACS